MYRLVKADTCFMCDISLHKKVKFALQQAMKAQRVSRDIAVLFL